MCFYIKGHWRNRAIKYLETLHIFYKKQWTQHSGQWQRQVKQIRTHEPWQLHSKYLQHNSERDRQFNCSILYLLIDYSSSQAHTDHFFSWYQISHVKLSIHSLWVFWLITLEHPNVAVRFWWTTIPSIPYCKHTLLSILGSAVQPGLGCVCLYTHTIANNHCQRQTLHRAAGLSAQHAWKLMRRGGEKLNSGGKEDWWPQNNLEGHQNGGKGKRE